MKALVILCFALVAAVHLWLIAEAPVCAFHSDSHTYLRTARMFWEDGHIGIHPKRSFLYPAALAMLHPLPGRLSLHILFVQHALALLVPWLGIRLRRDWAPEARWLDPPLVLALGLNVPLLFYSHDMIADLSYAVAFLLFLWRFWRFLGSPGVSRAGGVFWSALLALALRPDGKILVLFGTLGVAAAWLPLWRGRGVPRRLWRAALPWAACLGLWAATRVTQQGWLFYSSVFPLTHLESARHAEYKAELRPFVEEARRDLAAYPRMQNDMQGRLGHRSDPLGPKWDALKGAGQDPRLHRVCRELAIEAVTSRPAAFVILLYHKLHHVLAQPRNLGREVSPYDLGRDWREQMQGEPGYIPMLWGSAAEWERWQTEFFTGLRETRASTFLDRIEPWTAPPWWSLAGLASLVGWLLGVRRHGWRMALWLTVPLAALVLTYAIARGIPRYLLPFEPLWALGIALLAAEAVRLGRGCRT